jgi:hypothetical protein
VKATIAYQLNKDPNKDEELKKKMLEIDEAIQGIPWASETLREGLELKAPLKLDKFKIDSASGYFIKDNINIIEEELWLWKEQSKN